MSTYTPEYIKELIQIIETAEHPASVSNEMVAAILEYLYDNVIKEPVSISNAEIDDIIGDLDFDADGNPVLGACTCGPKLGEISREIDRIKSEIDAGADVESIGRQEILALLMENMMPGGPADTVCACAPKIEALEEHLETMEDELAVESIATDEIMSLLK